MSIHTDGTLKIIYLKMLISFADMSQIAYFWFQLHLKHIPNSYAFSVYALYGIALYMTFETIFSYVKKKMKYQNREIYQILGLLPFLPQILNKETIKLSIFLLFMKSKHNACYYFVIFFIYSKFF